MHPALVARHQREVLFGLKALMVPDEHVLVTGEPPGIRYTPEEWPRDHPWSYRTVLRNELALDFDLPPDRWRLLRRRVHHALTVLFFRLDLHPNDVWVSGSGGKGVHVQLFFSDPGNLRDLVGGWKGLRLSLLGAIYPTYRRDVKAGLDLYDPVENPYTDVRVVGWSDLSQGHLLRDFGAHKYLRDENEDLLLDAKGEAIPREPKSLWNRTIPDTRDGLYYEALNYGLRFPIQPPRPWTFEEWALDPTLIKERPCSLCEKVLSQLRGWERPSSPWANLCGSCEVQMTMD